MTERAVTELLTCAALVVLLAGCAEPPPILARLATSEGEVTVRTGESSTTGVQGLGLIENDVVSTGPAGTAGIEFEGGNAIVLGPSTSLVVRKAGATAAHFGAVLLSGEARARGGGAGLRFAIGTPFGIAELGGIAADVSLSTEDGLVVHIGKIEVIGEDGQAKTIEAGNTLTLAGLIVPIGADTLVLEPMTFVLLANPAQVQVKRKDGKDWRPPTKRDKLAAGDSVRTRRAGNTRLQLGSSAGVSLESQTELTLAEAVQNEQAEKARYVLSSGNAVFELTRQDGKTEQRHEIEVAGQVVEIAPGVRDASVEVSATSPDRAQITVRQGRAKLASGAVIEAGSTVSLEKGKPTAEARPLAQTNVTVRSPGHSTIYYAGGVPPVSFTWSEAPGPYELELARDREFSQVLVRELLTRNTFVHDGLRPGRYYWRVKLGEEWKTGSVALEKSRDEDCKNCKRTNTIDDTGENTVVYFQKALPAITLRWGATPGAVRYRVKVFADGAFDKPLVDQVASETTLAFPAGTFAENRYFWLVMAQNAEGEDIATGRMNSLTIAYDNAVADIDIKNPRAGSRHASASLTTHGEVELGSKLYINGRSVDLDKKGRFRVSLDLAKGENQIVYRTIAPNGAERMYVREVYRR